MVAGLPGWGLAKFTVRAMVSERVTGSGSCGSEQCGGAPQGQCAVTSSPFSPHQPSPPTSPYLHPLLLPPWDPWWPSRILASPVQEEKKEMTKQSPMWMNESTAHVQDSRVCTDVGPSRAVGTWIVAHRSLRHSYLHPGRRASLQALAPRAADQRTRAALFGRVVCPLPRRQHKPASPAMQNLFL